MIYLDNAATTLIKPESVFKAAIKAMRRCANPGRSGHAPSLYASEKVFECRNNIASLFGMDDTPERIVFTHNATHSLNIAIKSILKSGGHAVISPYEHNSVLRPLKKLAENGVSYSVADCPLFNQEAAIRSFIKCISEKKTDCVIVNQVSNVFGYELPVAKIDQICSQRNIPMIIDASQSAGVKEINTKSLKSVAYICMPGHKSLFGLQGTGVLICCKDDYLYSLIEGGTGSASHDVKQPSFLPDIYESGTMNVPGIAALNEGVKFIKKNTLSDISAFHREITRIALEKLSCVNGIRLITGPFHEHGVISFIADSIGCEEVGALLNENAICVRSGFHCAPNAHRTAGTFEEGTVRISISVFNTVRELDILCRALNKSLSKKTSVFY